MLKHRGFSAWITCDDEPLDVYAVETVGNKISCWVASETGKAFSVCWQNDNARKTATSGHVFIDGVDVASAIARPKRTIPIERCGAKTSSSTVRQFRFSALQLTDDEKVAPIHDPRAQDIGVIRVEITRVILGAEVPFTPVAVEEIGPMHEKAKKAGAHVTTFGSKQRVQKTTAITTAPYDQMLDEPYVTFIFRYRNRDFLMAQDIIPNPWKRVVSNTRSAEVIDLSADSPRKKAKREHRSAPDTQADREHSPFADNTQATMLGEPPLFLKAPDSPSNDRASPVNDLEPGVDAEAPPESQTQDEPFGNEPTQGKTQEETMVEA